MSKERKQIKRKNSISGGLFLVTLFFVMSCDPVGSLPESSKPQAQAPVAEKINLDDIARNTSSIKSHFLAYYQKAYLPNWRALRVQVDRLEQLLKTRKEIQGFATTPVEVLTQWREVLQSHARWWSLPLRPEGSFRITQDLFSYPWVNPCGIEQNVAYWAIRKERGPGEVLFSQQGLFALDYILFQTLSREQTRCRRRDPVLESWWQKSELERYQDQWNWAKELVTLTQERLQAFEVQWIDGQVWLKSLLSLSEQELAKTLAHAAFESEEYKEMFFQQLLGLSTRCQKDSHLCYQKGLFFTSQSVGFWVASLWQAWEGQVQMWSSYLKARNLEGLAEELSNAYAGFAESLEKLPMHEWVSVQAQFEAGANCSASAEAQRTWCDASERLNRLVRLLKRDLLLALSVTTPPSAQGDND
jgi:hypothetical protein